MIHNLNISLEDLHLFYHVAHKGGFLKAAQAMNICQGKASRRVAHIERVLGVILLHRNMRDIRLTEPGKEIYKMAQHVLETTHQAFTNVKAAQKNIAGQITLSVTTGFGGFCMTAWVGKFLKENPGIRLKLIGTDLGNTDLMLGEADIAIASSKPVIRESLHSQLLCSYPFHIYAAQEYLAEKGTPRTVQDLDDHNIIAWEEPLPAYLPKACFNALLYAGRDPNHPRVAQTTIVSDTSIATCTAKGLGLALMPKFLGESAPNLKRVRIQDEHTFLHRMNKKYISYPKSLRKSEKHKIFIEFILKEASYFFEKEKLPVL